MDPILGQIVQVPWHWSMRGWMQCRGQLLPIQQYAALYSLLGNNFGGDGRTTFAVPDLRPRDENKQPREWEYNELVSHIAIEGMYPSRD
jgi:microcystin-dependent protein